MISDLVEHEFRAMGGPARLRFASVSGVSASDIIERACGEIERLEALYSRYRPDSLISRINKSAGSGIAVPIDRETAGLFEFVASLHRESKGLFDPTTGPLSRAWDFRNDRAPSEAEVAELQHRVGWDRVLWSDSEVALPISGMEIDLGGVVKEYAADTVVALLRKAGVERALVELAGDIATLGSAPDRQPWRIAIRHPDPSVAVLGELFLQSSAIATSGDYERGAELDGKRLNHCIDPRSGLPIEGPVSVSVAGAQCLLAGAVATVAMLQTPTDAKAWLATVGLPWLMLDRESRLSGPLCNKGFVLVS